ncbi:hypothetical protein FIBSPDRAFT_239931 [Athelia psychrophila]|uniref:Nephrocystin 3-like N-terminal domain-containing protein n=1 Tax=Athelia psychrophila TaxID=1759441 RepID=A0A165YDH6_9AGAM|nr:hypothetical protein FIBSPDRAFT_239931 [Fibularhizoctonia sp. CBS 109695]
MDAPDTSPNFNAARKKHQADTGSWFLDGFEFTRWKEDPDFLLWLHGGPGSGKTILCASAIKNIIGFCDSISSTGYAYFFYDGTSAQAALWEHEELVRSIIMQLSRRCDGIPPALAEMYGKCDKGRLQPPIEMLEATLLRIVDSFDSVYIMIDSLDECSKRTDLLHWIQSVVSSGSGKIHMMVTSRPEEDISRCLRPLSNLEEKRISGHLMETDIGRFIDARLAKSDANKWKTAQKDMIRDVLISDADGIGSADNVREYSRIEEAAQVATPGLERNIF